MTNNVERAAKIIGAVYGEYKRNDGVDASVDRAEALAAAGLLLDEHDEAFYSEAFILAENVRRFLARLTTQRVIDAGVLDEDVVRDLTESADHIWLIRTQRISAARYREARG